MRGRSSDVKTGDTERTCASDDLRRGALSRRSVLAGSVRGAALLTATIAAPLAAFGLTGCRSALAGDKPVLRVGSVALACVLEGFVSEWFVLEVSSELAPLEVSDAATKRSIGDSLLLKGESPARDRFLDDARNAAPISASARDLIIELHPDLRTALAAAHKTWARAFARKVLAWTQTLSASPLSGKSVRDDFGRIYALEWAGAKIDPSGLASPAALGSLPTEPSELNSAAYVAYLERLVAILAKG